MPTVQTRHLKDGTSRYFVRVRDPVRHKETSETFATRKEAQQFCDEVRLLGPAEAIGRRERKLTEDAGPTVDSLFAGFIAWKTARVRSDRTIADYRRDYRNWIQPTFGARRAVRVTPQDVQTWVESMIPKLSPKSIADRHSLLHGIYGWAVRTKALAANPCDATDLPKRRKGPPKGLRPAEWQALYAALRQINPDAADLAMFLASTGWRFSEATALTAYDVDDYGGAVYVTVGAVIRRNAAGQHVRVDDAKTTASQRRIRLSPTAAQLVRRRLETTPPGGLVLTTAAGAQWHHSNFLHRAWEPAVKVANIPRRPTPHWLRHSHVFWLSLTGKVSPQQIQRRVGHEHIETTFGVYGQMIQDVPAEALDALDAMLGEGPGPQITA